MRRLRPQSVGAQLSLALLLVVAGALAVVYFIVVPSLERRLADDRSAESARVASRLATRLRNDSAFWQEQVTDAAVTSGTRVAVLQLIDEHPLTLSVIYTAGGGSVQRLDRDPVALAAARTLTPQRGKVNRGGARFAEAANLIGPDFVVLVSTSLQDADRTVGLVKRRILIAGALALALALLVGYVAARMFARRIRRLERAADRIAGGHFEEPVVDPAADELGELASAFDRMRERLAKLERARREFIANASHELRTPLFSLAGHLELLVEEDLDEATRREFLVGMREQVDRLTKLAAELLDLSRLDAGRLRVERTRLDLGRVADLLLEEFQPLARGTEHPLELAPDWHVAALGDEQRVLQIGRALIENALRHTPGGTRVQIETGRRNGRAVLRVVDNGPGIAPEHAVHVFERFYRTDGALASGSGLGLAIASELAEVMGGEIELESRPGHTVFTLVLPQEATASRS
ncbi:MAG TPA: HAMP domain-containing sensor histidine kinase [Gaiellaceae bacterium]|nr:HAMP domain-containing sensor histidine kinase [Gaiellaceae bacterium]